MKNDKTNTVYNWTHGIYTAHVYRRRNVLVVERTRRASLTRGDFSTCDFFDADDLDGAARCARVWLASE